MKYGLALEGGGAKGAFQIGVIKGLIEKGYEFEYVSGTSIGSLTGCMIVQGDFDEAYALWSGIAMSNIIDVDDKQITRLLNKDIDFGLVKYMAGKLKGIIKNKGIDTQKIRELIDNYVDEKKFKKSKIGFALVTVNFSDIKPMVMYKEDIEEGKLKEYLMASCNLPIFKLEPIDDKIFIDGGFYDNCPISPLIEKGCKNIIAVRTYGIGINQKFDKNAANIITIMPSDEIGMTLDFSSSTIKRSMLMGYFDAIKYVDKLKGFKYYIKPTEEDKILKKLFSMNEDILNQISTLLNIEGEKTKKLFFEKTFPYILRKIGKKDVTNYQDAMIAILEYTAQKGNVYKYKVYSYLSFLNLVKENIKHVERKKESIIEKACIDIINNM